MNPPGSAHLLVLQSSLKFTVFLPEQTDWRPKVCRWYVRAIAMSEKIGYIYIYGYITYIYILYIIIIYTCRDIIVIVVALLFVDDHGKPLYSCLLNPPCAPTHGAAPLHGAGRLLRGGGGAAEGAKDTAVQTQKACRCACSWRDLQSLGH